MNLLPLLALSPTTGDDSPTIRLVVLLILGFAVAAAIFFSLWKGKNQ